VHVCRHESIVECLVRGVDARSIDEERGRRSVIPRAARERDSEGELIERGDGESPRRKENTASPSCGLRRKSERSSSYASGEEGGEGVGSKGGLRVRVRPLELEESGRDRVDGRAEVEGRDLWERRRGRRPGLPPAGGWIGRHRGVGRPLE
jgi:hypothetical protein